MLKNLIFDANSDSRFITLSLISFKQELDTCNDAVIIDTRDEEAFEEDHLHGAIHMDFNCPNFTSDALNFDQSKTYFVYCENGTLSTKACEVLVEAGITKVYHLRGGMQSWRQQSRFMD